MDPLLSTHLVKLSMGTRMHLWLLISFILLLKFPSALCSFANVEDHVDGTLQACRTGPIPGLDGSQPNQSKTMHFLCQQSPSALIGKYNASSYITNVFKDTRGFLGRQLLRSQLASSYQLRERAQVSLNYTFYGLAKVEPC